jgi:hypothetical protein
MRNFGISFRNHHDEPDVFETTNDDTDEEYQKSKGRHMKKRNFAIVAQLFVFVTFLEFVIAGSANAYSTGSTGGTRKTGTTGCSCHGSIPDSTLVLALTGPSSVTAGQTVSYQLTVTQPSGGMLKGFDAAASAGTFTSGAGEQVSNGELTHSANTSVASYQIVFTAPASTGTVTLYATGLQSSSSWAFAPNASINVTEATGVENVPLLPSHISLTQNYPNPFNPSTTIRYTIPSETHVTLAVFDIRGELVTTLVHGEQHAGSYSIVFDAARIASGVYFYRLTAGTESRTRKFVILK